MELEFEDIEGIYRKYFLISTGMCIGTVGGLTSKGKFMTNDIIFPFGDLKTIPVRNLAQENSGEYACFISEPLIGLENKNKARLMLIIDYLKTLGVGKYFIIGNVFTGNRVDSTLISEFNTILRHAKVDITLIPNINDLGARVLPLIPIHHKLFSSHVDSLSNPCKVSLHGKEILVTTRFILEDLLKYLPQDIPDVQNNISEYKMHIREEKLGNCKPKGMHTIGSNLMNAMTILLKAGHVCPTAPDTMASIPFADKDPFTITSRIDYFCVGSTDEFSSRKLSETNTYLFTLPSFHKTNQVTVLNTESNEFNIVRFGMEDF